jgi:hypothetical protein
VGTGGSAPYQGENAISEFDDFLAGALKVDSRRLTAFFVKVAEIEMVDRPAACNSSSRRSSSCVQILYLFANIAFSFRATAPVAAGIRGRLGLMLCSKGT